MKFQRYCAEIDIEITNPQCRHFGGNKFHGYVIGERYVYLSIEGLPNYYCEFINNEGKILSDDFLLEWAKNTTAFIKETIGTAINPSLTMEVPTILRNLTYYENGEVYDCNNPMMFIEKSSPIVSLNSINRSYFITINNEPLYERGITDKRLAESIFNKLSNDIRTYIKKRWPIK